MKKNIFLFAFILIVSVLVFSMPSFAMKTKSFSTHEKILNFQGDFEVIDEITLKPGEEKYVSTYAYKPVTIDFKTSLTSMKKIKNSGIGIKKASSVKYYLKDPANASMNVLPENGVVKVAVKNFEKFPITLKLYKLSNPT